MRMTKKDFFEMGQRAARNGGDREDPPTAGWQRVAYDAGFSAEQARLQADPDREMPPPPNGPRLHTIDVIALINLSETWPGASAENLRRIAMDHNTENSRHRRGRLYRAVGRQLEKHGVRSAIPLLNAV